MTLQRSAFGCAVVCLALIAVLSRVAHVVATRTTTPQFRSSVDILQLDVSVLDKNRRPISGLQSTDFAVKIGGEPAPIVAFTPVALPPVTAPQAPWMRDIAPDAISNQLPDEGRLIVLLFDRSLTFEQMDNARRIGRTAVERMAPGDLIAVSYVGQAVPQNFTSDRARLSAAIDQPFLGRIRDPLLPRPPDIDDSSECFCGTCRLEAIGHIADTLRLVERRRRILVFIGSAITFQVPPRRGAGLDCSHPLKEARTRLFASLDRANVVVHSLDPAGLESGAADASGRRRVDVGSESERQLNLGVLPRRTGGRLVVNTNAPEETVADVLAESESYYVLGVERPEPRSNGRDHEVEIKVNRKGVTVSSTRAYNSAQVPSEQMRKPSPNDPPRKLVDALAGVWPATAIDLTMTSSVFDSPAKDVASVAIVTTITEPPDASERGGSESIARTLNVLSGAWDRNGQPTVTQTRTVEVSSPKSSPAGASRVFEIASRLELPRGKHDVRVAVEDPLTGRKGSVYTTVDVPNFDGDDLALSGFVVGAAPGPPLAPPQTFSNLLPIVPTAVRTFTRTSRAGAFVRVYQGGRDVPRDVTMKVQLVGVANTPIIEEASTLPSARFATARSADHIIDLPLAGLAPGPYLLTLTAVSADKTVVRHLRFEMK